MLFGYQIHIFANDKMILLQSKFEDDVIVDKETFFSKKPSAF